MQHRDRGSEGAVDPPAQEPAVAESAQGKQKRKRKEGTALVLQCTICLEAHYTNKCPQLRGPKPMGAYCGAAEDGVGFFQIQAAQKQQLVAPPESAVAA